MARDKKPKKLTEEELKRYERALQLWEVGLRRQEADLEERELELLVPAGDDKSIETVRQELMSKLTDPHFRAEYDDPVKNPILRLSDLFNLDVVDEIQSLENLAKLKDNREE